MTYLPAFARRSGGAFLVLPLLALSAALLVSGCAVAPKKKTLEVVRFSVTPEGCPQTTGERDDAARMRALAEQGDKCGQFYYARFFDNGEGGIEKSPAHALGWYQKAAEQGLPLAQFEVGQRYLNGAAGRQDFALSAMWFRRAAEQGLDIAMTNLAVQYEVGIGVEKDPVQAVFWYRQAAEKGSSMGQMALGRAYERGFGVAADFPQAVVWYTKAAEQGLGAAQFVVSALYFTGRGVEKDMNKWLYWTEKAAQTGVPDSLLNLGAQYTKGTLVEKNPAQAYLFFLLAEREEPPYAPGPRSALAARSLSKEQRRAADALAAAWRPGQTLPKVASSAP